MSLLSVTIYTLVTANGTFEMWGMQHWFFKQGLTMQRRLYDDQGPERTLRFGQSSRLDRRRPARPAFKERREGCIVQHAL